MHGNLEQAEQFVQALEARILPQREVVAEKDVSFGMLKGIVDRAANRWLDRHPEPPTGPTGFFGNDKAMKAVVNKAKKTVDNEAEYKSNADAPSLRKAAELVKDIIDTPHGKYGSFGKYSFNRMVTDEASRVFGINQSGRDILEELGRVSTQAGASLVQLPSL
jgi:hypothetical protein